MATATHLNTVIGGVHSRHLFLEHAEKVRQRSSNSKEIIKSTQGRLSGKKVNLSYFRSTPLHEICSKHFLLMIT